MVYKVAYNESVVEFVRNQGRIFLEASSVADARAAARGVFEAMRDESVRELGIGQYLITFKVDLHYKRQTVKQVERAVKLLKTMFKYERARYIERYIVANVFAETGSPDYLKKRDITHEITSMRDASVVAREVNNLAAFIDLDIAIYNYIEVDCKPGHRSRVVRPIVA